jgi:Uma2 family endonuclease
MAVLIRDPLIEEELLAERRARGLDRWDEIWEGVYVMAPYPNNEHQVIQARFVTILQTIVGWEGGDEVCAGVNVSDREVDWRENFRCPDVALFLRGTRAQNRGTFWLGGPDFAIEIISPEDSSRDKLDFYAKVGVRELLIVDRAPWRLESYRLEGCQLLQAGCSSLDAPESLRSNVVPLSFRMLSGGARSMIEVTHHDGVQRWIV